MFRFPENHTGLEKRFWARVDKSGDCWEWRGGTFWDGYPAIWVNGRNERGTRIAYLIQYGDLPANLDVLHRCDNPLCIRGDHLFLGTRADNCRDMGRKGRAQKGSAKWNAKLTESDIPEIRALRASGFLLREIGERFGVHRQTVGDVTSRGAWKHV